MLAPRSLADRLATARVRAPGAPAPTAEDRVATLARWFDARTEVGERGTALVIERTAPLPHAVAETLGGLAPAAYFDTETTGLAGGTGTYAFMALDSWRWRCGSCWR